ncbi:hypothetical protein HDU98_005116 [Podochytrium sp. JEL0797]|nr:hypothetical protein HDU98_005116 [Podochytrium sp. JEL0797]
MASSPLATSVDQDVDTPEIRELSTMLGIKAQCTASDGRRFCGVFLCVDKYKNVILSGAEEFNRGVDETTGEPREERRYVGMVMIPGKHLVRMQVESFA